MRVGSLVECIDNRFFEELVKLNTPYTVRFIIEKNYKVYHFNGAITMLGEDGIYLEEVNGGLWALSNFELPFPKRCFKELLPPIEINIEEILLQEV